MIVLDSHAQTITPSEQYYRENIATDVALPSTRAGDDDLDPGGSSGGQGGWVGSAPISDAITPILIALGLYGTTLIIRRREKERS